MSPLSLDFEGVRALRDVPIVVIDDRSVITEVNDEFTRVLGWTRIEAVGQCVSLIIPSALRDAHHMGFSRFVRTGVSTILGRELPLATIDKTGREFPAMHYVVGEKKEGTWRFAASIRPTP